MHIKKNAKNSANTKLHQPKARMLDLVKNKHMHGEQKLWVWEIKMCHLFQNITTG